MKRLHRPELFCWSRFDVERGMDFHSVVIQHPQGNLVVDPLPLAAPDREHLESLGGVARIVITNSTHVRAAAALAKQTGAEIFGPYGEMGSFPVQCAGWLNEGDAVLPGIAALAMQGSKTPGELALLLGDHTLITGDLVRAPVGGRLDILPDAKLADRALAIASVGRLAGLKGLVAVLPGDGWPVFRDAEVVLGELYQRLLAG